MTEPRTIPLPPDLDRTQPLGPYAGWYGKMPCLGDFASRRLVPEFIEPWDRWLQRSIAASRQQLGERWLDLFLTSPMWRFAVAPGVCGEYAWAGLLVPSVDKVGRYFPLTLAVPLERSEADFLNIFAAQAWYAQLEKIGLSALNVEYSTEQLELALAVNPFPLSPQAHAEASAAREVAGWLEGAAGSPHALAIAGGTSVAAVMHGAARALFSASTTGKTFWWSIAQDGGATAFYCSSGLPPEDYYAVLLGAARARESPAAADALSVDPLKAFGFEQSTDDA
jgi:type VI secretion system protein ImpM